MNRALWIVAGLLAAVYLFSGTVKLIMGLPLFAPMVAVTWLAVRALYPKRKA